MPLNYLANVITNADHYEYLYAALQAVCIEHNTRGGDTSTNAYAFRKRCTDLQTRLLGEVLRLRPECTTPGWIPENEEDIDPALINLKQEGKSAHATVDVEQFTGVDLESSVELGPDPLENYTTYTELDPNGRYAVAANTITITGLTRNEEAWIYDDKDASHFGATFEHLFDATLTGDEGMVVVLWAVSNVINDRKYWLDNTSQVLTAWIYNKTSAVLRNTEGGTSDNDTIVDNTHYWYTPERTSETAVQLRVYDDAPRTSLVFPALTQAITSGRRYQYVFAVNCADSGEASACSGTINNLDLQEAMLLLGGANKRGNKQTFGGRKQ